MSEHPESLLMWAQQLVGDKVICSHCGQARPCDARVTRHRSSDVHRVECSVLGRCLIDGTRVADGGAIPASSGQGIPAQVMKVRGGMTHIRTMDGQDAIVPVPGENR